MFAILSSCSKIAYFQQTLQEEENKRDPAYLNRIGLKSFVSIYLSGNSSMMSVIDEILKFKTFYFDLICM